MRASRRCAGLAATAEPPKPPKDCPLFISSTGSARCPSCQRQNAKRLAAARAARRRRVRREQDVAIRAAAKAAAALTAPALAELLGRIERQVKAVSDVADRAEKSRRALADARGSGQSVSPPAVAALLGSFSTDLRGAAGTISGLIDAAYRDAG